MRGKFLTTKNWRELVRLLGLNYGPYRLKGVEESLKFCEVGETGKAALTSPADTEKAHRYIPVDAEPVLGW